MRLFTYTRGIGVTTADLYSSKFIIILDFSASLLESFIMSNRDEWTGTFVE